MHYNVSTMLTASESESVFSLIFNMCWIGGLLNVWCLMGQTVDICQSYIPYIAHAHMCLVARARRILCPWRYSTECFCSSAVWYVVSFSHSASRITASSSSSSCSFVNATCQNAFPSSPFPSSPFLFPSHPSLLSLPFPCHEAAPSSRLGGLG